MAIINTPPFTDVARPLFTWLTQVYTVCFAVQESGITANRPVKNLWIGRRYFDTTINKPVYLTAVSPNVWRDSQGVIA